MLAAQLHVGDRQQQLRIVAGGLDGQVFGGGREIAARDERCAPARDASSVSCGCSAAGLAQRRERFVGLPLRLEGRRDHPELLERRRVLPRAREVAGGEIDVEQLLANLVVVRVQLRRLAQRPRCASAWRPFLGELAGDLLQVAHGAAVVAHLDAGAGRRHAAS